MQPESRTEVDALVEAIRAQLDADEQLARAAVIPAHDGPDAYKPHPELAVWRYAPGGEVEYVSTPEMLLHEYAETFRVTCDSEGILPAVDESVGPHIARHDPARVLRLVAAHREILELHAEAYEACRACGGYYPCPTIRHLASAYAETDSSDESGRSA